VLAGGGPGDVVELTLALAREMLAAAGRGDVDPADKLADGSAMDVWQAMVRAQDGDPDAPLPTARETEVITADADGVLTSVDALAVGVAAWRLGAGRARKEDPVQAGAGVELHAKPGDTVRAGQPLLTLHTDTPERFERATAALAGAYAIGDRAPERTSVVLDRITA
jgi:thymidine phosphorylase